MNKYAKEAKRNTMEQYRTAKAIREDIAEKVGVELDEKEAEREFQTETLIKIASFFEITIDREKDAIRRHTMSKLEESLDMESREMSRDLWTYFRRDGLLYVDEMVDEQLSQ